MVFSSIVFLVYFFPLFLLVYYIADKKIKNYIILIFSLFFYSWGASAFIFVLLPLTGIDFLIVRKMYAAHNAGRKKILLIASLLINLGILSWFKYSNFFVENLNTALMGMGCRPMGW